MNEIQHQEQQLSENVSAFPKFESIDRMFAVIYLLVGYLFISVFSSFEIERNLSLFTIFYAAVVLIYLWGKEIRPPKESWFWLAVMLAVGVPYGFWSVMYLFQILALTAVAAYWTLSVSGRLLKGGRTSEWVFFDGWNALAAVPFCNFGSQLRVLFGREPGEEGEQKTSMGKAGGICLGILITVPVLVIILPLLVSADAGFQSLMGDLAYYTSANLTEIFVRMIFAIPVSFYLYGLVFGGFYGRHTDHFQEDKLKAAAKSVRKVPDTAICTVLTAMCLIYCLFIGLQGSYLFSAFAGKLPPDFTYSEYARRGFFELCEIGVWNLIFAGCAGAFSKSSRREQKGLGGLMTLLAVLTLLLLVTAVSKMGMYIRVYGLTVNRILPLVFMLWMGIVFVCMILGQWKTFPAVRFCVMTGAVMFCLLCIFPIEYWTELYNVWARTQGLIV